MLKFSEKSPEPFGLRGGETGGVILGFARAESDATLFLGCPGNERSCQPEGMARSRVASVVACPIAVDVREERVRGGGVAKSQGVRAA